MFAYYSHIEPYRTTHSGAIYPNGGVVLNYLSFTILSKWDNLKFHL
jgi:hypothetical protein